MLRRRAHTRAVASGLVALALGATLFFGGMAAGSDGAAAPAQAAETVALPDWFLPIWDAYGRNPEITPWFDFASLYTPTGPAEAGAVGADGAVPHGAAVATGPQGPLAQSKPRG